MDKKGLPNGCSTRDATNIWICTHHSLDGKMHLAFGSHDLVCKPWPITADSVAVVLKPVDTEVATEVTALYPEWADA
ncbi:hypothetical protein LCGC14_2950540 [marine sediment metagenome]|uniref:Uncharacterized protein n=1 Tax=marine sediment metagenome TaxID=412755 RepID=A0A0F8Y2K6_9ZZZZ